MMKEMKKNETIERAFREYFDGAELPPCDLTQAKAELSHPNSRKKRGLFWKIAPALACFLIVCIVSVNIMLNSGSPGSEVPPAGTEYYTLTSAQAEYSTYSQLSQRYSAQLNGLSPFEWADNAQAEYTLYAMDGKDVLIRAHLKYLYGYLFWEGEVYIDLTSGTMLPEELEPFDALQSKGFVEGYAYRYSTEYRNGEYISDAKLSLPSADFYMTIMSQNGDAVFGILRQLAENA